MINSILLGYIGFAYILLAYLGIGFVFGCWQWRAAKVINDAFNCTFVGFTRKTMVSFIVLWPVYVGITLFDLLAD